MADWERNYADIVASHEYYCDDVSRFKEIAEKRRQGRKYRQEYFLPMYLKLKEYVNEKKGSNKPMTISGLILASNISKNSFYGILNGKFDYALYQYAEYNGVDLENDIVEELDGMPYHVNEKGVEVLLVPASEILNRVVLLQQEETETRLYEKGRVGDIFALKAQHGWQEEEKQQINNNTLVIATEKEAELAMNNLLRLSSTE